MDVITLSSDEESDPLRLDFSTTNVEKQASSPMPNKQTVIQRVSDAIVAHTVGDDKSKRGSHKRIAPVAVVNGAGDQLHLDNGPSYGVIKLEPAANGFHETGEHGITSEESKLPSSIGKNENNSILFKKFIEACSAIVQDTEMDTIIAKAWRSYSACNPDYVASKDFMRLLNKKVEDLKKDATSMFSHMLEVCMELKSRKLSRSSKGEPPAKKVKLTHVEQTSHSYQEPMTSSNEQATDTECNEAASDNSDNEEDQRKQYLIKKLNSKLKHCSKVIRRLEHAEVDWDNDGESTYIQVQQWRERAVKLYKKICEYTGERDKSSYRIHLTSLNSNTKFPEVDRCIRKFVNDTGEFPDFQDILKFYKEYNEKDNLNLTPIQVQNCAADMFQMIGNELQRKRRLDTWDLHCDFLLEEPDPADDDSNLTNQLKSNRKQFISKINQLVDDFAQKQVEEKLEPADVAEEEINKSEEENSVTDDDMEEEMQDDISGSTEDKEPSKVDGNCDTRLDSKQSEDSILDAMGLICAGHSEVQSTPTTIESMPSPKQVSHHHSETTVGALEEKSLVISGIARLENSLQNDNSTLCCTKVPTAAVATPTASKNGCAKTLTPVSETDIGQLFKTSINNCGASVSSLAVDSSKEETNNAKFASVGIDCVNNDFLHSSPSIFANKTNENSLVNINCDYAIKISDSGDCSSSCIPPLEVLKKIESVCLPEDVIVSQLSVSKVVNASLESSQAAIKEHEELNVGRDTENFLSKHAGDSCVPVVIEANSSLTEETVVNQVVAVEIGCNAPGLPVSTPPDKEKVFQTPAVNYAGNKLIAIQINSDNSNCSASIPGIDGKALQLSSVESAANIVAIKTNNEDSSCCVSSPSIINQVVPSFEAVKIDKPVAIKIDDIVGSYSISSPAVVGDEEVSSSLKGADNGKADPPADFMEKNMLLLPKTVCVDDFVLTEVDLGNINGSPSLPLIGREHEVVLPEEMHSDKVPPKSSILSLLCDSKVEMLSSSKTRDGVEIGDDERDNSYIPAVSLQAARDLKAALSEEMNVDRFVTSNTAVDSDLLSSSEIMEEGNYPKKLMSVNSNDVDDPLLFRGLMKEMEIDSLAEAKDNKNVLNEAGGIDDNRLHSSSEIIKDRELDLQNETASIDQDCKTDTNIEPDLNSLPSIAGIENVACKSDSPDFSAVATENEIWSSNSSTEQIDPSEFCSVRVVDDSGQLITSESAMNDPSEIDIGNFLSVEIKADNVKKRVSIPRKIVRDKDSINVSKFVSVELDTLSPSLPVGHHVVDPIGINPLEDEVEVVSISPAHKIEVDETDPDIVIEKVEVKKFLAVKMTPNHETKSYSLPNLVQKKEDIDISNYLSVEVNCDSSPLLVNVPKNPLKSKTLVERECFNVTGQVNSYDQKTNWHSKHKLSKDVSSGKVDVSKFVAVEIGLTVGKGEGRRPVPVSTQQKFPSVVNTKLLRPQAGQRIKKLPSNYLEMSSNYKKSLPTQGSGSVNSSLLKLSSQGSITVERLLPSLKVRSLGRPGFSNSKNVTKLPTIDDDIIVLD